MWVFFKAEVWLPAMQGVASELALQMLAFLQHTLLILVLLFLQTK